MVSPTGKGLRQSDKYGRGAYGVSRRSGTRKHQGADYICEPGQDVVAPIAGTIKREARPYPPPDWFTRYSGLVIENEYCSIKLFYLEPMRQLIGQRIRMGQTIGVAQDISKRYEGMIPHVHLEITSIDPALFTDFLGG